MVQGLRLRPEAWPTGGYAIYEGGRHNLANWWFVYSTTRLRGLDYSRGTKGVCIKKKPPNLIPKRAK